MIGDIERALMTLAILGAGLIGVVAIMGIWFICFPFRAIELEIKRYISAPRS